MLKRNVEAVRPKPFKMLFRVLATYIKGQMKLKVIMKLPASVLLYKTLPAKRPNRRNMPVQRKPSSRQY